MMELYHAMTREELLCSLADYVSMTLGLMEEQAEKPDANDRIYQLVSEAMDCINEELDKLEQSAIVTA